MFLPFACLEIDSPSRGRKLHFEVNHIEVFGNGLEIDSPSRGRKRKNGLIRKYLMGKSVSLEIDSPSRGRKLNVTEREYEERLAFRN